MRQLSPLEKQRGELLAYFLNRDLDEFEEIGRILQGCQELHALYIKRPPAAPSPVWRAYELKRLELGSRVNDLLRRFPIVLGVEVHTPELSTVSYPAFPVSSAKQKAAIAQFTKSGARVFGPHTAVQVILEMTGAGTVDRIRRCENPSCQKWLMATSKKRVTCNDACRFAKYQTQKGSRANDMRLSREAHKNHPRLKKQKGRTNGERKG